MSTKNDFENKMNRLQEVATKLKSQDITLDEASKLYEEGVKLSKQCKEYIDEKELLIKNVDEM
ncbi:exodeoxyribonuclease VII small subunit [Criibacterium bergeronii]|nr:exodeoxyribonuclease VII small subunit [Criibacterium bergeronii]